MSQTDLRKISFIEDGTRDDTLLQAPRKNYFIINVYKQYIFRGASGPPEKRSSGYRP